MKVLFVVNNFYAKGNGLSGSAKRTAKKLIEAGIEVKVLSGPNPDPDGPTPEFLLKDFKFPVFDKLIRKQGYSFSKADKKVITEAVRWADLIHVEEPFILQRITCRIAQKEGKPITGTYHLHPENLYASIGLQKSHLLNDTTMRIWRNMVFNKCEIIQCPTEKAKERLVKWKFKPEIRVISNGLVMEDLVNKVDRESALKLSDAKYNVITIGRYSNEKDLKTLLYAMRYTHHGHDTQLIFAGRGPQKKKLERIANKLVKKGILKYPPIFGFYSLNELQELSLTADLYIHCAFVEVEGLSAMEAIQVGIVPIIAQGKYTSTSQFALSEKSIYQERNQKDLAAKIDYWLDHDEERLEESKKYIGLGDKYNIDYSITQIIKMFEDAIKLFEEKKNKTK